MAVLNRIRPPHMVAIQLKKNIAVGTETIFVVVANRMFTPAPRPTW